MNALSRTPLLPVAATSWTVAAVLVHVPGAAGPTAVAAWSLVAGGAALAALRRRGVVVVLAIAAAAVVATHIAAAEPLRERVREIATGAVTVVGTVTTKVERAGGGGVRFTLDTDEIQAGPATEYASVPVRVIGDLDVPDGLDLGARVTVTGSARATDAGEAAVIVVFARDVTVDVGPDDVWAITAALRDGFVENAAGLPDPGGGLLPGLAVGDTRSVATPLDAAMKATSLSHLTAVSGANCAIVTGLGFALAALCGARRVTRIVIALTALAGFVALVTPEASVVRAAAMGTSVLVALLLGRPAAGLSALAAAVCALLAGDPWLSRSLGFALSAAATASLLVVAPPLARGLGRWMPRVLALAVSVPLAAQVACGPLLLLVDPGIPVYGVAANLTAGPAAPVATVVGLIACLTAGVPVLAEGLAGLAWLPSSWIAHTALTLSTWPGGRLPWPEGALGVAALAIAGAAVVGAIAARGTTRAAASALVVAFLLGGVGTALAVPRLGLAGAPAEWSVAACDVGQGDAVLVRSAGAVALVDTGPDPAPLAACLQQLAIGRIDLLVLTHFDDDHVGGVAAVRGRVDAVLHGPPTGVDDRELLDSFVADGVHLTLGGTGRSGTLGDAHWSVLWPRDDDPVFAEGNDASVVLRFSGPRIAETVLLGDLSARAQRALLATGRVSAGVPVVKVAHHGSADQEAALYTQLAPTVALVTVGENDYGHPRDEILRVLEGAAATVARTDRDGLVLIASERGSVVVWRERDGDRVRPAG